jgi:hypothetical protein
MAPKRIWWIVIALVVVVTLSLTTCGKMDLFYVVQGQATDDGLAIYVSRSRGNDADRGLSPERPVASVQQGIRRAAELGATEVRLSAGGHPLSERLYLDGGISLVGGYSSDFLTHDPEQYGSTIRSTATAHQLILLSYREADSNTPNRIEGCTIEVYIEGTDPLADDGDDMHPEVISIGTHAPAELVNNVVRIHVDGAFSATPELTGIVVGMGSEAVITATIEDNDFLLSASPESNIPVNGIRVQHAADGSSVSIQRNRLVVYNHTGPVVGLRISGGTGSTTDVINNVVSVEAGTDAATGLWAGNTPTYVFHNTIVVCERSAGNAVGIMTEGTVDGDEQYTNIHRNILAVPEHGPGLAAVQHVDGGDRNYNYNHNLAFHFQNEQLSDTPDGRFSIFTSRYLFDDVFASEQDGEIFDGDDADYHLTDTAIGGPYAIDQAPGVDGWSATEEDIERNPRPQGTAPDLGAYESTATLEWVVEQVPEGAEHPADAPLVLDSHGRPHIIYRDGDYWSHASRGLRHAWWDGGAWQDEIVVADASNVYVSEPSVAIDAVDNIHVSYSDVMTQGEKSTLMYALWDGESWSVQTVDSDTCGSPNELTSLTLDADGDPHISYYGDWSNEDLKHAYWTGAAWQTETADDTLIDGRWNSMSVNPSGYPVIIYSDAESDDLRYTYKPGTVWSSPHVIDTNVVEWDVVATADGNGGYYIVYRDETTDRPKYAEGAGHESSWTIEPDPVDFSYADSPQDPSIAYSPREVIWLCYEPDGGTLGCATLDLDPEGDDDWQLVDLELPDTIYKPGSASIELNVSGMPQIAFVEWEEELYYARLAPVHPE